MEEITRSKVVHGGNVRWFRKKENREILDFSASMNPFPPEFKWRVQKERLAEYPDDTYCELKEAIGRAFSRQPDEIAVGNGSIEIIRTFCAAVLGRGDRYFVREHTFGEYAYSAALCGAIPASSEGEARAIFICNPNNPTGELSGRDHLLQKLEEAVARDAYLFVDEAFIELSDPSESLAGTRDKCLFVCRSLTKSFAVPGLRIGFGFGEPELVESMEAFRLPWTLNVYAEAYALEAMKHLDELERSRQRIAEEREWVIARLEECSLAVRPSRANFILVDLPCRAAQLQERLLEYGILVRDCASFGLPYAIRIGLKRRDENERLVEAIRRCLH